MNFSIKTSVKAHYLDVAKGFTLELFKALAPAFPRVKVLRFDGCEKGHQVWIELNLFLFKQRWDTHIVENGQNEQEWYFIDEGTVMPFPLKTWKHIHQVLNQADGTSQIVDNIYYSTGSKILDYLMFPLFYQQFSARGPIYKKIFLK